MPARKERLSFPLRLEPALHESLQRWAEAECRSLNGQIVYLLRECVRRREHDLEHDGDDDEDGAAIQGRRPAAGNEGEEPSG